MMNKRSSRLIAWLLTLVMVLNMSPVSAFAGVESGEWPGPKYSKVNINSFVDDGNAPTHDIDSFTAKYVVSGEYTSTGEYYLLEDYTRTVTNKNPSAYQEKPGNLSANFEVRGRRWDDTNKVLTLLLEQQG